MAYKRTTNLIARPVNGGYSLSGIWDDISSFGKSVLTSYGDAKKAEGAATVLSTPNGAVIPGVTPVPDSGPSMGTIVVLGAVGIGAVLLLKKRKK
jgi:hypothetical protein